MQCNCQKQFPVSSTFTPLLMLLQNWILNQQRLNSRREGTDVLISALCLSEVLCYDN